MRRNSVMEAIWKSGRYYGNRRANAYVTVNPTWTLQKDYASGARSARGNRMPFRHYANTGSEIDVPRSVLRTITIDRGMTDDTGQMTLVIKNVHPNGGPRPDYQGYFSVRQGSAQAMARWPGKPTTEWGGEFGSGTDEAFSYGYLGAGNMIRTWQGWGGYNLSRSGAIGAGNVVPTGTWIIDDCNETARGELTVVCRDVGSLLVDQILYPPYMPDVCYPTQFYGPTWNTEVNENRDGYKPTKTNYEDLIDICELLACWGGFHSPDLSGMLGLLESTGIDSKAPFKAEYFDKKSPIDVIKEICKIVGYRPWVDQEGGLHITSRNNWQAGNRDYGGGHTPFAFDIDELKTLMDLTSSWTKRADRSHVIVSQGNPKLLDGYKNASFNTNSAIVKNQLHGMTSPAFFALDRDMPLENMVTLAELTGLRMWFARHRTSIKAVALPLIDPDDQVRVFEATTWETYLHRVMNMNTTYDEITGVYVMAIEGQWVGPDNSSWQVYIGPGGHVIYN